MNSRPERDLRGEGPNWASDRDAVRPVQDDQIAVDGVVPDDATVAQPARDYKIPALNQDGFKLASELTTVMFSRSGYSDGLRARADDVDRLVLVDVDDMLSTLDWSHRTYIMVKFVPPECPQLHGADGKAPCGRPSLPTIGHSALPNREGRDAGGRSRAGRLPGAAQAPPHREGARGPTVARVPDAGAATHRRGYRARASGGQDARARCRPSLPAHG